MQLTAGAAVGHKRFSTSRNLPDVRRAGLRSARPDAMLFVWFRDINKVMVVGVALFTDAHEPPHRDVTGTKSDRKKLMYHSCILQQGESLQTSDANEHAETN